MNWDHGIAFDVRLSFIGKCCLTMPYHHYVSRLLPSELSLVGVGGIWGRGGGALRKSCSVPRHTWITKYLLHTRYNQTYHNAKANTLTII